MYLEQMADELGALAVPAQLEEIPTLSVAERRIGYTFQGLKVLERFAEDPGWLVDPDRIDGYRLQPQIEPVEILPDLRRQLISHLTGIVTSKCQRCDQRRGIIPVERE